VVKPKNGLMWGIQQLPIPAGSLQQSVSTYNVGFDKISWAINRAIYVGFGGQMHNRIWLIFVEYAIQLGTVTNIDLFENVPFRATDFT